MSRFAALLPVLLAAQTLTPKPSPAPGLAAKLNPAKMLALPPLSDSEKNRKSDPRLQSAGIHRQLKASATKTGKWQTLADRSKLWRMAVKSPGAKALRLHFTKVNLESGRLWLHTGGTSFGPYSGKGPMDNGDFWADITPGESVTIEFLPGGKSKTLPFEIPELSHLFQE